MQLPIHHVVAYDAFQCSEVPDFLPVYILTTGHPRCPDRPQREVTTICLVRTEVTIAPATAGDLIRCELHIDTGSVQQAADAALSG